MTYETDPPAKQAYTLLCSTVPALIRSVERSPTSVAARLNQLLLDKVNEWIAVYRSEHGIPEQ